MLCTLKVVVLTRLPSAPLVMLQLPLDPVVQLMFEPPAVKEPLTTAPACAVPELFLTLTLTVARQLLFWDALLPVSPETDTVVVGVGAGSFTGSVACCANKSKLAEPKPALLTTPVVACSLMRVAS